MKNFIDITILAIENLRSQSIGTVTFTDGLVGFLINDSTETTCHIVCITSMGGVIEEYSPITNRFIKKIKKIPEIFKSLQDLINSPLSYKNRLNE